MKDKPSGTWNERANRIAKMSHGYIIQDIDGRCLELISAEALLVWTSLSLAEDYLHQLQSNGKFLEFYVLQGPMGEIYRLARKARLSKVLFDYFHTKVPEKETFIVRIITLAGRPYTTNLN